MDLWTWETGIGKENLSVKDVPKVSGLGRRLESRRAPTEPKTWGGLYLYLVTVNSTGGGERLFCCNTEVEGVYM